MKTASYLLIWKEQVRPFNSLATPGCRLGCSFVSAYCSSPQEPKKKSYVPRLVDALEAVVVARKLLLPHLAFATTRAGVKNTIMAHGAARSEKLA